MLNDAIAVPVSAAFAALVTIELILVLPLGAISYRGLAVAQKAARLLANRSVSQHWKERALLLYAAESLGASLRIGCIIFGVFGFFSVVFLASLSALLLRQGDLSALLGIDTLLAASVLAAVYAPLRTRSRSV
ncbi:MAG: hypothetical protein O7G83_03095 [Proteobacteria bacterium]|nr:hypothetical protein [Pseudomonadota bacterium]